MLTLSLLVDMFVHLQRNFVTCSYLSHKQLPVSFKLRWISVFRQSFVFGQTPAALMHTGPTRDFTTLLSDLCCTAGDQGL